MGKKHVLRVEVLATYGEWVPQPPVFGSVEPAEAYGRTITFALDWRVVDDEGRVQETERSPRTGLSGELDEDEIVAHFQRARIEALPPTGALDEDAPV